MKTLTIEVPDPVFRWLDAAAKQRQQTPEQAASEALTSVAESPPPSLAELLADSKGIGRGEHTDLSVNPRHMDDFGR
jgi:predicted transcriptional regulator